jgi:hypothetical protein
MGIFNRSIIPCYSHRYYQIVLPPSTTRLWTVSNEDALEHKKIIKYEKLELWISLGDRVTHRNGNI